MNTAQNQAGRQLAFNDFVTKLRAQGKGAIADSACVYYNADDNTRCGIGHFIAPVYSPLLEGKTWKDIVERAREGGDEDGTATADIFHKAATATANACHKAVTHIDATYKVSSGGIDENFFVGLQEVHDQAYLDSYREGAEPFTVHFERRAAGFAEAFDLTMPEAA